MQDSAELISRRRITSAGGEVSLKILFIVPYVPNLIRVRPFQFIRALTNAGHRVTLITLWSDAAELNEVEAIKGNCEQVYAFSLPKWRSYFNCATTILSRDPLQSAYCWQPEAAMKASELIADGQFDIVHVEHLRGARMGLAIMAGNKRVENHTPIVWDSVDNIAHLFRQAATKSRKITSRLLTAFELGRTERYEGWLLHQFDHTLVTSNNDREAFLRQTKDRVLDERITVVNNGVDLNYFQPPKGHIRNAKTLVMSGKLSYHANVNMVLYMVRDIMPLIWKEEPNVCLVIVGKDPPEEIRSLAGDPRIEVTGTVRDIRPYLQKATIAVAPITYGAGIQNKVLEAMACATPVVSTPQAVSALAVEPGENVLIGADATAFAAQVIRLLKDEPLRDKIGQAGRQYVEDYHSWDKLIGRLVDIYQMVIESTRGTAENLKAEHPT